MGMLEQWYTYDVYVSYYHGPRKGADVGLGMDALNWIRGAIDALAKILAVCDGTPTTFHQPQRDDPLNPSLAPSDAAAIDKAAVWLVFLTPEYGQSSACLEEARRFVEAMKRGQHARDQLIICELLPVGAEQRAALPWRASSAPSAGAAVAHQLYDHFTRTTINDQDRVERARRELALDIQTRLKQVAGLLTAADSVAPGAVLTADLPDQVYLFECIEAGVWQTSRDGLIRASLAVNPESMEEVRLGPRQTRSEERQRRRERRRQLLENSLGLVLLRSSEAEDLGLLASETLGDMKDLGRRLPSVFVDWVDKPDAAWPHYFKPERVHAAEPDWAEKVLERLRGLAETGARG